ncbi:sugar phosphate nucleotidyltransferase [Phaeodactylibacter luteus]|uniref:Glucose-1-phosphate thymidylyltransferase n=1 Tax=Phaeodactylibacter luteus TaxID=1564516 RepID=A0A5C6RMC4_9BACT|nr:sugar phosphate nucleotidyltransferase [Phaeodactylibacter luteus]TXB63104.1 glucose-1-phosphate thymidylyltransferase [Phaeodactylibacter luteus]
MKAIIPVAGAGTRLRPLTYTQPKPLIPVAGKPIISFIIDQLIEQGIRDFVFVIGYLGEKIRNYVDRAYPHINREYITQDDRLGSGHAIWTARELLDPDSDVVVFFGDIIIDVDFKRVLNSPDSCLCIKKVQDPRKFGVVELGPGGEVRKVAEKPKIPKSDMAMVGFYKVRQAGKLIEALDFNIKHNIRSNGEFPLTDAFMRMIEQGARFSTVVVDNWFDCGKKEVLLDTNAAFLDREGYASTNLPQFDNSIIIHPVSIGQNCKISNSIIGPHVTIGNNARISHTIIKDSIIGNYAHIKEVILQRSVVGNDTAITGLRQSLNLGDNTEIDFSLPRT